VWNQRKIFTGLRLMFVETKFVASVNVGKKTLKAAVKDEKLACTKDFYTNSTPDREDTRHFGDLNISPWICNDF
jgi:hypothetical protein